MYTTGREDIGSRHTAEGLQDSGGLLAFHREISGPKRLGPDLVGGFAKGAISFTLAAQTAEAALLCRLSVLSRICALPWGIAGRSRDWSRDLGGRWLRLSGNRGLTFLGFRLGLRCLADGDKRGEYLVLAGT